MAKERVGLQTNNFRRTLILALLEKNGGSMSKKELTKSLATLTCCDLKSAQLFAEVALRNQKKMLHVEEKEIPGKRGSILSITEEGRRELASARMPYQEMVEALCEVLRPVEMSGIKYLSVSRRDELEGLRREKVSSGRSEILKKVLER